MRDDDLNIYKVKRDIDANTTVFKNKVVPAVSEVMDKPIFGRKYKDLISNFISFRTKALYDTVPCDRIICSDKEMDKLFEVLNIEKAQFKAWIKETYYGELKNFSPLSAYHEFTIAMMHVIRYYVINDMEKEAELAMIHLAFSGKFYPSLHYRSFRITPVRHVMEYVVNNKLSKKYDLTAYGSVIGAVKSIGKTWLTSYEKMFKSFSDGDVIYLINQLYSRIGSFMINIAKVYYDAYENKDYIAMSSDNYDPEDFHIADSDSNRVAKFAEKAINYITTNGVNYKICSVCVDDNITPNEIRTVITSIVSDVENTGDIKEFVYTSIALYFQAGYDNINDLAFITFSIAPKPNAKQKEIVRQKEIIENWLENSGSKYLERRQRLATKNSYEKMVRQYFALVIHEANK